MNNMTPGDCPGCTEWQRLHDSCMADWERVVAERDTLRAAFTAAEGALRKYGEHKPGCVVRLFERGTCICGLEIALRPAATQAKCGHPIEARASVEGSAWCRRCDQSIEDELYGQAGQGDRR